MGKTLLSALLILVTRMNSPIKTIFKNFFISYCDRYGDNPDYYKVANAIVRCKSGALGYNVSHCDNCGHVEIHNNSCRNRHCPNCQAIPKELWIDARKSEVVDAPYFHVVFTLPSELNPLIFANQKLLYSLMHSCVSETLLELAADKKYLGAKPGIIQVLHTWGQKLDYHPHIHAIVTGGGLDICNNFRKSSSDFFIPVQVLSKVFRGKFLASLRKYYDTNVVKFSATTKAYRSSYGWNEYIKLLYEKEWIPFIKKTFNGYGNAIEYLGRYTHRIAICNSRILSVSETDVTFQAKDYKNNTTVTITLDGVEFIRRFLMHVLPKKFQKIRSFGFLCNRTKKRDLKIIRQKTNRTQYISKFQGLDQSGILSVLFGIDIKKCPCCNSINYHSDGKYHRRI